MAYYRQIQLYLKTTTFKTIRRPPLSFLIFSPHTHNSNREGAFFLSYFHIGSCHSSLTYEVYAALFVPNRNKNLFENVLPDLSLGSVIRRLYNPKRA